MIAITVGVTVATDTADPGTTATRPGDRWPRWSPVGDRIAFLRTLQGGWYLMTVDARGGPVRRLGRTIHYTSPWVWSPDGRRIAYTDESASITIVDVATGVTKHIAPRPDPGGYLYEVDSWSPDGTIRYTRSGFKGTGPRVEMTMRSDGSRQRQSPEPKRAPACPPFSWCPASADGRHVAYVRDGSLYIAAADNGTVVDVPIEEEGQFIWHPSRSYVVFNHASGELARMDAGNGDVRVLTGHGGVITLIGWSRSGTLFAYRVDNGSARSIWSVDSRGVTASLSGSDPVSGFLAGWAPRGDLLLYWTTNVSSHELVAVGLGGKNRRTLIRYVLRPTDAVDYRVFGWPSFAPDGRRFTYFDASPSCRRSFAIHVGSIEGGRTRPITCWR